MDGYLLARPLELEIFIDLKKGRKDILSESFPKLRKTFCILEKSEV